jgi:hypothetical protein
MNLVHVETHEKTSDIDNLMLFKINLAILENSVCISVFENALKQAENDEKITIPKVRIITDENN